jgi:hypothetical protein
MDPFGAGSEIENGLNLKVESIPGYPTNQVGYRPRITADLGRIREIPGAVEIREIRGG